MKRWTILRLMSPIFCFSVSSGGSPASFVMELWRPGGQHPFGTWTNTKAEFNLPSMTLAPSSSSSSALNEQQVIEVRIFAMNSHGRSDAISLYLVKEKLPLSRLGVDSGTTIFSCFISLNLNPVWPNSSE